MWRRSAASRRAASAWWNDATEAALKPILASVRKHSKIAVAMQLAHAGRKGSSHRPWEGGQLIPVSEGGWQTVGPSAVPQRRAMRRRLRSTRRDGAHPGRVRRGRHAPGGWGSTRSNCMGARLSLAPIPVADFQQAHRPVWRLPAEPHALSARSVRRDPRGAGFEADRRKCRRPIGSRAAGIGADHRIVTGVEETRRHWIDASCGGVSPLQRFRCRPVIRFHSRKASRKRPRHHHGGRPDHRGETGRGDRSVGQGRHGRARPRHALRPALGLARRRQLGGQVEAPPQYWRSQPSTQKALFGATTFGAR